MNFPDDEESLTGALQPPEKPEDQSSSDPFEEEAGQPNPANEKASSSPAGDDMPQFDFPRMEDDVAAFRRELNELKFTPIERVREEEPPVSTVPVSPRRRRRSARIVERLAAAELGERFESIAQRASPTFDFFVFSFFCACILAVGYILDAPAILLIGILVTPLLAPWAGAALSVATGEVRFFGQTFGGILTALGMVFIVGLLAGFASRIFQPLTSSQAFYHARLWWPDLLMLVIGTVILIITFIQSDEKPLIASLMIAYQIYLPISAAGFGLGSGVQGLWPQAGLVFLIHISLSLMVSLIVYFYMGFRPLAASGYALMIIVILAGMVIMAGFAGLGSLINVRGDQAASATPAAAIANTPRPFPVTSPTPTITPAVVLSATPSPTLIPPPSPTRPLSTATIDINPGPTLLPTPVYGRVQSPSGGLMVRVKPGGATITTVQNGYLVEILGDPPVVLLGATWVHVIIVTPARDIDGWVLLNLIITATPSGSP